MSSSFAKRAVVGDTVPYGERHGLGEKRSKATLKRAASLQPASFEKYAWALKYGGSVERKDMQAIGLGNVGIKDLPSTESLANDVYKALTPITTAAGVIQKPSDTIKAIKGGERIQGLLYVMVGPADIIDAIYTSGVYSLIELQQFARALAGAIVDIRFELVDQILAPVSYYDRSLDTLTLRQGLNNVGKDNEP